MVLLGIFILVAGTNAGKIGLDRWVVAYIQQVKNKKANRANVKVSAQH